MKTLCICLSLSVLTGCNALRTTIFHPLHKVWQIHEYNEANQPSKDWQGDLQKALDRQKQTNSAANVSLYLQRQHLP